MDELADIQQQFLRGQELTMQGQALQLEAFNRLVASTQPQTTGLYPSFGVPTAKVKGPEAAR